MTRAPRRKKTETLDVRVSHEEKRAFMEAVSQSGDTASSVIRNAMSRYVRLQTQRSQAVIQQIRYPVAAAIALSLAILGWQSIDLTGRNAAFADDISSSFEMSLSNESGNDRSHSRVNTTVTHELGEPVTLEVDTIDLADFGFDLDDSALEGAVLSVELRASEAGGDGAYLYEIGLTIRGADGEALTRAFTPAISVMAEEQGAIRFDTQGGGQIAISVTPHRLAH